MMRFLRFVSVVGIVGILASCAKPYGKNLTRVAPHPGFDLDMPLTRYSFYWGAESQRALYRCHVNGKFLFKKIHLSGLLLLKYDKETKSVRAVFTNELGYKFFDFEFNHFDSFTVHSIIHQFDKPVMVRTLRQDIDLLLALTQDMQHTYRHA